MLTDRIEAPWLAAFEEVLRLCAATPGLPVCLLAESQSRALNLELAELAALRLGCRPFRCVLPTPPQSAPVPVRSTGASRALQGHPAALAALKASPLILDLTLEGLLHAPELKEILGAGSRVMMVSNEHPEALARLVPRPEDEPQVKAAVKRARAAKRMTVTSAAGTDLTVTMEGAATAGVWGWTDRPGTVAHWPGGVVVSFPRAGSVNGTLVLDAGDVNLTFKRYLERPVRLTIEDDHVTAIAGEGTDAELMRRYWAAWGDRAAYAVSHVGWGLNGRARYEALAMYDQRDTNGTELRAFAGNFLFSTGANEFAGRYTEGHFDIPVRGCTIALDGEPVVTEGRLVA
ncbi:2,5-dihydroxypyridine 5,6-dioxygenase [Siccirubricoccus sp. KC 17139]|uniref:2,5-dihydroxypyridine 5,6-dioxygenase n=1 Tax=Siccirubricoccus soli TaxID=2899147 RepID=A0ABT1CYH3_9PROT|nr:2,5-dihydroxypyridine 5,6-dioxygenase [Siccirubricoccus soli]MCO6414714.1 2,5-dihydroxypyridine 5,6-dioxygenase [Siccirubricoccus soli]MCP2680844.1 2,5-dihydroxypyridine 5,6-dioxygenase [Siccirubricoccus soli]